MREAVFAFGNLNQMKEEPKESSEREKFAFLIMMSVLECLKWKFFEILNKQKLEQFTHLVQPDFDSNFDGKNIIWSMELGRFAHDSRYSYLRMENIWVDKENIIRLFVNSRAH